MNELKINQIEVKSILSKSNLPACEYSVNPYVGCPHALMPANTAMLLL